MKFVSFLLLFACLVSGCLAQAVGQWELRKRGSTGFTSYGVTAENGKALGFTGGVPTMLTIGSGSFSDLTGKPTTLAGYGIVDSITAALAASTYATIANLALKAPLASPTFTGTVTAPDYLLNDFTAETLTTGQAGMGWDENGYFTIGSSAGWLQIYEAGDPLENTIHFAGRFTADAIEAASITGDITGEQVASGHIPGGVMAGSMPRPMLHWQNSATYAGANGLTYAATGPGGQVEPQTPAMYFAGIEVIDGDPNANYLQGRIRSASQMRSDLGLVISTNVMPWVAPSTSGNVLTSNGSAWVSSAPAGGGGGGAIAKTGFYTKTDTATTTSTTFTTAYSTTFTPSSASNSVVITASFSAAATTGYAVFLKITRGGTDITVGASPGARVPCQAQYNGGAAYVMTPISWTVKDSPASTSAQTYRVEWCVESGATAYINRSVGDSNTPSYGRTVATLKFEEVTP